MLPRDVRPRGTVVDDVGKAVSADSAIKALL